MKLLRMKSIHYRIFRDYSWPDALPAFGRYNAIYGWNGCGKTTLSALLVHLQSLQNITEGKVQFEFEGEVVEGRGISTANIPPIRVFNRDFHHSNFLETRSEFSPIYVIGHEDAARQKEIDSAKATIEELTAKLEGLDADEYKARNTLRKYYEKKAKSIKDTLRDGETHRYNSYDRSKLEGDLLSLTVEAAEEKQLDALGKKALRAEKDAKPADSLDRLASPVQPTSIPVERISELLATEVVAQTLDDLARNQSLSRWVQDGLELHRSSTSCGFCGERIASSRFEALAAHFNESLRELQGNLKTERDGLRALAQELRGWSPPDETRLYDDLRTEYLLAKSVFENSKKNWLGTVADIEQHMSQRLKSIFERSEVDEQLGPELATQAASIVDAVLQMNAAIARHNERTENFADAIAAARDRLAWGLIAENFAEHGELQTEVDTSSKTAAEVRERLSTLSAEVTQLEREMREHRRAADDLNADLHSYLGRKDLEFVPEENGYSVRRHGQRAQHLSEGEKTAITFLYFLKTLQDQSFDIASGIVVIDDPVSSLDANALFSAFAYMRERTKSAAQLFILTHNFSFFRQVKNWFHALNKHAKKDGVAKEERPPARFYQLTTTVTEAGGSALRSSTLSRLDAMLEEFESEYHYLFKTVFQAQRDGLSTLEQAFPMPNLTRRLLESFLAFRYPQRTGGSWLFAAMSDVAFDEGKKHRVLRYLNTHSHTGMIDDGGGDPWSLGEVQEVLSDILALIRSEDSSHFDGMVTKVTSKEEAA